MQPRIDEGAMSTRWPPASSSGHLLTLHSHQSAPIPTVVPGFRQREARCDRSAFRRARAVVSASTGRRPRIAKTAIAPARSGSANR